MAQHFAEERRILTGLRGVNERLMASLEKLKRSRVRVAVPGEVPSEEDMAGDEGEPEDTFLQELLRPMLMKMAKKMATSEEGEETPAPNGTSKE